jgi:hypothetical protein
MIPPRTNRPLIITGRDDFHGLPRRPPYNEVSAGPEMEETRPVRVPLAELGR